MRAKLVQSAAGLTPVDHSEIGEITFYESFEGLPSHLQFVSDSGTTSTLYDFSLKTLSFKNHQSKFGQGATVASGFSIETENAVPYRLELVFSFDL